MKEKLNINKMKFIDNQLIKETNSKGEYKMTAKNSKDFGKNPCESIDISSVYMGNSYIAFGTPPVDRLAIKEVIYNPPLTIVNWLNGDKSIAKQSDGDVWDEEKSLCWLIAKRALGEEKGTSTNLRRLVKNASRPYLIEKKVKVKTNKVE